MLLAAGFAALFMMQPQKAEAYSTETNPNYRIVLRNSRGEAIGATNLVYGNSGTAEDLGRTYCYWSHEANTSYTFRSAHAVVSTLNEPLYEGDEITIQFMAFDPGAGHYNGRNYLVQYQAANGGLYALANLQGTGWKTQYTIPSVVPTGCFVSIVVGDSSTNHPANGKPASDGQAATFFGGQMVHIVNFTTKERSTTGGWGSGSLLDAVNSAASGGTYTYTGNAYAPFQALIERGYVKVVRGTASATNAGEYSVTLKPAMEYKWSGADGYGENTFTWKITQAQ